MPKTSQSTDELLETLDHPMRASIAALRTAILSAGAGDDNPDITEHVKWNAPSYVARGDDRVTFRFPPKGGIQLVFHRGSQVRDDTASFSFDDPSGLLVWITQDRGTVTFADDAEVDANLPAVTELVRAWVLA